MLLFLLSLTDNVKMQGYLKSVVQHSCAVVLANNAKYGYYSILHQAEKILLPSAKHWGWNYNIMTDLIAANITFSCNNNHSNNSSFNYTWWNGFGGCKQCCFFRLFLWYFAFIWWFEPIGSERKHRERIGWHVRHSRHPGWSRYIVVTWHKP